MQETIVYIIIACVVIISIYRIIKYLKAPKCSGCSNCAIYGQCDKAKKKALAIALLLSVFIPARAQDTLNTNAFRIDEVQVTSKRSSVIKSRVSAIQTERITTDELCKAACCNLSESFETSASVDVSYADAATGAKQIRLLGLSGTYVQMLTENTPNIRGLAQSFGMEYIPGPWMSSIQVSKGTSSVVNGYEALTGQINVEYLKPQTSDRYALNAMLSKDLHAELNFTGAWDIDDKCATSLMLHAQDMSMQDDHNKDGFIDMPVNHQLNVLNRWYIHSGDYTGQVLIRGLYDQRIGGQSKEAKTQTSSPYTIDLRTRRIDAFVKNGYIFNHETATSIGIIAAGSYHDQSNVYGTKEWKASQTNMYLNAIFQTNFDDEARDPEDKHTHKLTTGLSLNYDGIRQRLYNQPVDISLNSKEFTPGIFAEYTYNYQEQLTLLAGIREDWSSDYGFFTTPRLNVRYSPTDWLTMRASAGMGYRTPYAIADNAQYMVSNRSWTIPGITTTGQDIAQEKALNTGATITFYIPIADRQLQISGEYYYTRFIDGVIADIDKSISGIDLRNIKENSLTSFAHNWQIETSIEILRGWTLTGAFRYTDARQTSWNSLSSRYELREKALQNRFKGIISTSYQTPLKKWQFDFTAQFNGPGRMPDGFAVPTGSKQYHTAGGTIYHNWYPQLLAQVTKYFRTCSLYVGAENMTNYTQDNPIVSSNNPSAPNFDASMVWAPIHGWKLYMGFRWSMERAED